jgi:hypothetical protein
MTSSYPLPKRVRYRLRSGASSFSWQSLRVSLRSLSNCLRLLPHLPVTSILPSISPATMRCRMQYLRRIYPTSYSVTLLFVGCK